MNELQEKTAAGRDLILNLVYAAHRVEDRLERALAVHGLSLAKLNVLTMLVESDKPLSLGEIANRLACVRSNVTQLVDRLESDGLVRRQADPSDRRSIGAVVTVEGRERQKLGSAALTEAKDEVFQQLANLDASAISQMLASLKD